MDRVDKNYVNHYKKITFTQPLFRKGEYIKEIYEKLSVGKKADRLWKVRYESNTDYEGGPFNGRTFTGAEVAELCNTSINAGIEVEFDGQDN